MARTLAATLATVLGVSLTAAAAAAPAGPRHAAYLYVKAGFFSITLAAKGHAITSGAADPQHAAQAVSQILVLCPGALSKGLPSELHVGVPSIKLTARSGHLSFSRKFTERRSKLVVLPKGPTSSLAPVTVTITGVVRSANLITGTLQVEDAGCPLARSPYQAKFFTALH